MGWIFTILAVSHFIFLGDDDDADDADDADDEEEEEEEEDDHEKRHCHDEMDIHWSRPKSEMSIF